jgi:glycosyltransferase involved in cell wall biosynthesis
MVARTRYILPLPPGRARKFAALGELLELRVLATSADGRARDDGVFHLVGRMSFLDGPLFWLLLPLRVRRLARAHRAEVILAQSPYEALLAGLLPAGARVVVEIHGDWRTATRLYGSPLRRLLSPVTDALGRLGLRRAAAVRTLSPYTSRLVRDAGVEPVAEFEAFVDLDAFLDRPREPVPESPAVVFVGVLERYKNVDGLAAAWRIVARRVPDARLHLIGTGALTELAGQLEREGCTWDRRLEPAEVAAAIDGARALLLPSASEGLPRVAIEAFVRGRAVVGTRAGGIPDIVEDGVTGLLVGAGDTAELAAAIERIVTDRALAVQLGAAAAEAAPKWITTPEAHAARVRDAVDKALAR